MTEFLPHLTFKLAEGILKPDDRNEIYWVDIQDSKICYYNFDRKIYSDYHVELIRKYPQRTTPSAIFETNISSQFFVASQNSIFLWDQQTNQVVERIFFDEIDPKQTRFNDGKLDPRGNLFIGTLDLYDRPNRSALYRLDLETEQTEQTEQSRSHFHGAKLTKVLDASLSNGLGWSLDGMNFYYIDTPARSLQIFSYNLETATIVKPATHTVDLSKYQGVPDGLTVHPETGNILIAMWGGSSILEIDLQYLEELKKDPGNKSTQFEYEDVIKIHKIEAKYPSNCTFITKHQLIITTARQDQPTSKDGKLLQFLV